MQPTKLFRLALAPVLLAIAVASSAPRAEAQHVSIGFGTHGRHASLGIGVGFDLGAPWCARPAPIRCAPAPVRCAPIWIPGHYAFVERKVYVPGCTRQEYVPAVYEDRCWRDYCGRLHHEKVLVAPATWRTVQDPGTWKCVTERVWVDGCWRS